MNIEKQKAKGFVGQDLASQVGRMHAWHPWSWQEESTGGEDMHSAESSS